MSQPSSDGEPVSDYFEAEDFASVEHLCDVGGGEGRLLCAVLAEYPHLEGTVFDVPTAIEGAHRLADSMGVAGRCSYVAGDMFETVPAADGYIFRGVLSNWADDECETILSNVHEAANAEARLFVIQRIVSEHAPSEREVIGDISQLVYFGGRHRTRGEFRRVFERSGWTLESSRAVEDNISSVLVARKAGT